MTKEEFEQKQDEAINAMTLEELRAYAKRINSHAQNYFSSWQQAEKEIERLQMELCIFKKDI
jgi:HPt (histidine-containing phosphotransfer) domain-containing protein